MGFLAEFEHRIENALGRLFPKKKGEGVQPIEIAKCLVRAMEAKRRLSVDAVYVPNRFCVQLHPDDFRALEDVQETVKRDATVYVTRVAQARGLAFTGPLELQLCAESTLAAGELEVEATYFEQLSKERPAPAAAASGPHTLVRTLEEVSPPGTWPKEGTSPHGAESVEADVSEVDRTSGTRRYGNLTQSGQERETGAGWLMFASGPLQGTRTTLKAGRPLTLGRSKEADLVLEDRQVSRNHAVIRFTEGAWWVEDLGSANGTRKNGKLLQRERLSDGDELSVGLTTLTFHSGPVEL